MRTIEFHTRIKNGAIEIPGKYRDDIKGEVHVILLPGNQEGEQENMIDQLFGEPLKVDGFKPLPREEIYER